MSADFQHPFVGRAVVYTGGHPGAKGEQGIVTSVNESANLVFVRYGLGTTSAATEADDLLLDDHGIYIQPINYPTVAKGTERLRITPTPWHDDRAIDHLVQAMTEVWSRLALRLAA
jgi:7-keto-8-aminopelargonate synthetase-like enzyme